ncbi:MAG: hypothetical protein ABSG67_22480 [Thermoguttaceae bacterium]|jgi:hypothetical protein
MNYGLIFVIVIGTFLFLAAILRNILVQKRTHAWKRVATELGLTYFGMDNDLLARFRPFHLFQEAMRHRAKFIEGIGGHVGSREIIIADLNVPPSAVSRQNKWQAMTICAVSDPNVHLPYCLLRPQAPIFDSIGKLFGKQDIDFLGDLEFSQAFVLQGSSEPSIRGLFTAELRRWFVENQHKHLYFEGNQNVILLHRHKMISPQDARILIEDALDIHKLVWSEAVPVSSEKGLARSNST